jgi:hypothetical protein
VDIAQIRELEAELDRLLDAPPPPALAPAEPDVPEEPHGPEAADDELLVSKLAERVRATIQGILDRHHGARKSVFFG